jgi:hypothetical protein
MTYTITRSSISVENLLDKKRGEAVEFVANSKRHSRTTFGESKADQLAAAFVSSSRRLDENQKMRITYIKPLSLDSGRNLARARNE